MDASTVTWEQTKLRPFRAPLHTQPRSPRPGESHRCTLLFCFSEEFETLSEKDPLLRICKSVWW